MRKKVSFERDVTHSLTRAQCLDILRAPRGARLAPFAEKFNVPLHFVRYVRHRCKWILHARGIEERLAAGALRPNDGADDRS